MNKVKRGIVSNSVDLKTKTSKTSMKLFSEFNDINEQLNFSVDKHQTQNETYWAPLEANQNITLDKQSIVESGDSSEGA